MRAVVVKMLEVYSDSQTSVSHNRMYAMRATTSLRERHPAPLLLRSPFSAPLPHIPTAHVQEYRGASAIHTYITLSSLNEQNFLHCYFIIPVHNLLNVQALKFVFSVYRVDQRDQQGLAWLCLYLDLFLYLLVRSQMTCSHFGSSQSSLRLKQERCFYCPPRVLSQSGKH